MRPWAGFQIQNPNLNDRLHSRFKIEMKMVSYLMLDALDWPSVTINVGCIVDMNHVNPCKQNGFIKKMVWRKWGILVSPYSTHS